VSENRVLRRIFGPKWEVVAGGWRRLHNEELHNLYATTNIIRVIKWDVRGGTCSTYGRDEKCTQDFGRKFGLERPLGRPRHRWEDNIRMDVTEIGW
jgi:hypothetical protein